MNPPGIATLLSIEKDSFPLAFRSDGPGMGASIGTAVYRDSQDLKTDAHALTTLACDVSFMGDAALLPHELVAHEIARSTPAFSSQVYWRMYDRLETEYSAGRCITRKDVLSDIADQLILPAESNAEKQSELVEFFARVNDVFFQQQALVWLAGTDFKISLYGAGWEKHSTLSRFACGPIAGDAMRIAVYRASRINLSAGAFGAVDARLNEGIEAGGFFIMRYSPADVIERFYPPIWNFCRQHNISDNAALKERATPGITRLLDFAGRTMGIDLLRAWPNLVDHLREADAGGYSQSAAAIWPQYPAVCFSTRDELIGLISKYLYDVPLRRQLAEDMRRQLVSRFQHVQLNRAALRDTPMGETSARENPARQSPVAA